MAGNHRVVALEIGTENVVAVQGLVGDEKQGERTAVVEKIVTTPVPQGVLRSNGIHAPDIMAETLRNLWRTNGLQTKNVIVGINARRIHSGVKWLDYLDPESLAKVGASPKWVADQGVLGQHGSNVDPKKFGVHHWVLRERSILDHATGRRDRQMLMMAVLVPKDLAQAYANVVEDAGLELVGMDLTAFGTLRAASHERQKHDLIVDLIVDVGETFVTMILHHNGNIRAVETISSSGGEAATDAIAAELKRLPGELKTHKIDARELKHSLAGRLRQDPNAAKNDPVTRAAFSAVTVYSEAIVGELRNFIDQYLDSINEIDPDDAFGAEKHEDYGVGSVTLTGGGANLFALPQQIQRSDADGGLGITTRIASVSPMFVDVKGNPVERFVNGVSVVSAVGLLTADRKGV